MTTVARAELIEGLKRDMYAFWFEDAMLDARVPLYQKIFKSSNIQGSAEVRNSALLNVTFKETNDREKVEYTDPTTGRKFVGKLRRFTAATQVERDLIDKDAIKDALKNMLREWQDGARRNLFNQKEQYFANLLNYAGYTAGNSIYNNTSELFSDPGAGLAFDGYPLLNLSGNARTYLKTAPGVTNSFYNSLGASGTDLTSDNFDSAYTLISATNAYNDGGQREYNVPTHLIVSPSLRAEAYQILRTTSGVPGEVNNGANHNLDIVEPLINPFIKGSTSWYVYSNTGKWLAYDQEPPIFDIWFDQETKTYRISIDVRYGHCLMAWNVVAGGNIATS